MEVWKDIPGFEGFYQISDLGRVKSLKYNLGLIVKGGKTHAGYMQVTLSVNKVKKTFSVHQLVAMSFLNHKNPSRFIHVDHIDGNRLNNNLCNLQIISCRENTSKAMRRKSKYIGVTYLKASNTWLARIESKGERKSLGVFKCETKAHLAYQIALKSINSNI